jgi:hypothetical protein
MQPTAQSAKYELLSDSTRRMEEGKVSGALPDQTVNDKQNNRAYQCDENAAKIEGFDLSQSDETAKESAQNATGDADKTCDQTSTGILAGHDQFRESTCDQT